MKKQALCVGFLCLLLLPLLSGCGYKGVDKRSFVVGMGIDPAHDSEHKYRVTVKVAKPISALKNATETEYAFLTQESDSVAEAIRFLETKDDKLLDFSQAKILALNEELLQGDLFELMDYVVRRGDMQLVLYVLVARPDAEQVLRGQPTLESAGENALYNFFDGTGTESPFVTTTFLFEFRRDYDTKGLSSVLPIVIGKENGKELEVNKAIVLKNSVPPVVLSSTETKLYNTLYKGANGYGYRIENDGYKFLLTIDRAKMKIKMKVDGTGQPTAKVSVKLVGAVNESNKILYLNELDKYNKISEERLTEQLTGFLKNMQEKNVDPFGFGLKYRASRLNTDGTVEEWKKIYPELVFDVAVDVKLKSVGALQ
ncbi:Ger(x)C family spore germination protein [Sporosarcina trichiuri]|uniref:Ger(x)C family spore germination protein n=1 Tax=Sporosarcina trichiuri TaxID=3056445 RepID=UPI0025B357E7|nr:Ger(x)C family spore germination protein [Sporosarcina sp. 0.2-SM1T-5]WJY27395.1 Ger(x)C family spore germination protein [Sporosarcina sp. 0.2-SM1T-5]